MCAYENDQLITYYLLWLLLLISVIYIIWPVLDGAVQGMPLFYDVNNYMVMKQFIFMANEADPQVIIICREMLSPE